MKCYPIYLLELGDEIQVVFPEGKEDIDHADFWEETASLLVAQHYNVPAAALANLPYSQRQCRVVNKILDYGERDRTKVLRLVQKAVGEKLTLCYEEHEKRLPEDVRDFRRLLRKYLRK